MIEGLAICIACGFVTVNTEEKFCPTCGKKLLNKCTQCNTPINHPMARFCPVCGTNYMDDETGCTRIKY